jgi:hypothetical protein
MGETSPPTPTGSQPYVERAYEALTLVVSAAGISLFLYGAAVRREHFSDFALFWLLSGAATPSARLPQASPQIRVLDWIGIAAGVLSLAVGIFSQRPFLFVGISFCFSAWGSIVDQRSAGLGKKPAWRLLLSLVSLASLCVWLWYVLHPTGARN